MSETIVSNDKPNDGRDPMIFLDDEAYKKLRTSKDKIKYILKAGAPINQIREEIRHKLDEYRKDHRKCETTAMKFRDMGSKLFELKDYKFALQAYNKVSWNSGQISMTIVHPISSIGNTLGSVSHRIR